MSFKVHQMRSVLARGLAISALMSGFTTAHALDSANVLPVGVNSPAIRSGVIGGVGQRYTANGSLMSLNDVNSIEFDVKALVKIEPRVEELVSVLNQFGRHELGSALNLGVLKVDTAPSVRYLAPLHAFGVTPKWTLAVGVPVVTYENKLSLSQTGSNLSEIRSQVRGLSKDLDNAFDELNVNLVESAQVELAKKGYKPLVDRKETIIGDVQLASLYQVYSSKRLGALLKTMISLPTGPKDDPDDVADLGDIFGQPAVEQIALVAVSPFSRLKLAAKAGYKFNIPDELVKRVPKSEEDSLPAAETKENVRRKTGDVISAGLSASLFLLKSFSIGAGYDLSQKARDQFSGDRGTNYALLSRETESSSERVRLGASFDSTGAYFDKEALFPAIVSYEFSDTVRGVNTARQSIHEVWVTLFF